MNDAARAQWPHVSSVSYTVTIGQEFEVELATTNAGDTVFELGQALHTYFQIGDNPGRKEPLSGEINYQNIFRHIKKKGFTGVLGMEHGNSQGGKEGERKLIDAYRWCDQ